MNIVLSAIVKMADREWGWWRLLKAALALAHSGAVVVIAVLGLVSYAFPGGQAGGGEGVIPVALLGLPWSITVLIGFQDGSSAGVWARAHKWVPLLLMLFAMGLNSALLWFWTLYDGKGLPAHDRPLSLVDRD